MHLALHYKCLCNIVSRTISASATTFLALHVPLPLHVGPLAPYVCAHSLCMCGDVLIGGKDGPLYDEICNYFYLAQLRAQVSAAARVLCVSL